MKKTELQPEIEYAIYGSRGRFARHRAIKMKFTAEQIEKAKGGEIVGAAWVTDWGRNWLWANKQTQLNKIQEPWEDYEKEEQRQKEMRRARAERAQELEAIRETQERELESYLKENGERLRNLLGVNYSRPWKSVEIEIKLNREQIEALLERIG